MKHVNKQTVIAFALGVASVYAWGMFAHRLMAATKKQG